MVQSIPWVRKGLGRKMRRYNQQIHSILVEEGPIEITHLHTRKAGETGLDGLNSSCFRSSGFTSNHHRSLLAGGVETGFRFTGSCIKLTYIHLHATISLESGTFWYSEKNRDEGEDAIMKTLFEYEHVELHYSGLYMKQLEYRRCLHEFPFSFHLLGM